MKKNINILFGFLTLAILLAVTGCKKDEFPVVAIDGIDVDAAYPGDVVAFTGQGLDKIQFLFVGTIQTPYTLDGNMVTFTVPEKAVIGPTTITLAMVKNQRVKYNFEVLLRPTPSISAFDAFVPVGEDLVITGTSFNQEYNPTVTIGGVTASIVTNTETELTVTVPSGVSETQPLDLEITSIHGTTKASTKFYAKESLVANPQLEEGTGDDFTDWEKLNGGDGMTAVSGDDGYGGTRSMHVVPAASNPWNTQFASTGVPLVFGDQYTVVLWAKGDAAGAIMRVSVSQYDGAGADYFYGETKELSTVWQQYTWTFTVGKDLPTHRVVLDMGEGSVPFTIDHIGLVEGLIGSGQAPDLMVDGAFENGLPGDDTGWSVLNGDVTVTTSDVFCGTNAIQAVGAGSNPWNTQMASALLPLEFDATYEVSFWAKAAGADGVIRVSASQYDGAGADYFYGHNILVAEEWTQYSYVFTVGKDLPDGHRIVFDMGATAQTFLIDAVEIREYDPPESLLIDPSFESGALPGDEATGWQLLNGDVTITTDEAYNGSNSIKVVGAGANPWNTQLASELVPLTFGKRYSVKLTAKADAANTDDAVMRISVSQYDGAGADYYYGHDVVIGSDWTTYTWNFEVTNDLVNGHKIVLDMGSTAQTFYIDDVIVYEIPEYDCGG